MVLDSNELHSMIRKCVEDRYKWYWILGEYGFSVPTRITTEKLSGFDSGNSEWVGNFRETNYDEVAELLKLNQIQEYELRREYGDDWDKV